MNKKYFSNLTNEERKILVEKGTEAPFSGEYNDLYEAGIFICRACESPLYESNTKFDSGCGWPSFDDEIFDAIVRSEDLSNGRVRTEICCAKCNGHLGHVFSGEKITQKNTRHCVNSLSIKFIPYANLEQVILGGGCFWYMEKVFKNIPGIYLSSVGYSGGNSENPTYEDVCKGDSNHAEVINLYFNPEKVSFDKLLQVFWDNHDPTTLNKQRDDEGTQYRSVIFYTSKSQKSTAKKSLHKLQLQLKVPVVTQLLVAENFYRAEEYHQNYLQKNNLETCSL